MSILKTGLSAIGKLAAVALLAAAFFAGMLGVLYFALRSPEVKVPSIVGKDMATGEQELAALGLKIHKRADRYSEEKQNTILEQTPIAGEMVKGGQTISIVISRSDAEGAEKPAELKKESVDDKKDDDKKDANLATRKKINQNTNLNKNSNSNKTVTKSNKNANSSDNGNSNAEANSSSSNENSGSKNDNSSGANKPSSTANTGAKPNSGANTSVKPTPPKNTNQNTKPTTPTTTSNKPTTSGANRRPNP